MTAHNVIVRLFRYLRDSDYKEAAIANDTDAVKAVMQEALGPDFIAKNPLYNYRDTVFFPTKTEPALYGDLILRKGLAEDIDAFREAGGKVLNWKDAYGARCGELIIQDACVKDANGLSAGTDLCGYLFSSVTLPEHVFGTKSDELEAIRDKAAASARLGITFGEKEVSSVTIPSRHGDTFGTWGRRELYVERNFMRAMLKRNVPLNQLSERSLAYKG